MKKHILTCFLASLCLFGSTSTAQVADSPGADFLHRSGPCVSFGLGDTHRSGETRSDTLPEVFDLVDHSAATGQGGVSSSASVVEAAPLAAYVETRPDTLSIGDQIPSGIEFSDVLHYDSDKLRLDDYRGKYVILEFWASWCSASSGSLPEIAELQEKFEEDIQFIPVSYESPEKVSKKLTDYKSLSDLDLPLVVNEKRLAQLFPHISLPHLVILDREGIVVGITGIEDLTEQKLDRLLKTGVASFRMKEDSQIPFTLKENLISGNQNIPSKNIRFQSALTQYIPGVSGTFMDDRADGAHILAVNVPLIKLYRLAYTGRDLANFFGLNRTLIEGFAEDELDTFKSGLDYISWMEEGGHVFGYELIAPPGIDQYQMMREDLARFFPEIVATVEMRTQKVWALTLPEGKYFPESQATEKIYQFNPTEATLKKSLLLGLIYQINLYSLQRAPYPLIDMTSIDYPIDVYVKGNFSNPEELKAAFEAAGFNLELREEEIPVLVLKKVSTQNTVN